MTADITATQRALCRRYGVSWFEAAGHLKVGITRDVRSGRQPVNGLRHRPERDTTGWYIWAGEEPCPEDPSLWVPLHVSHLSEWCPSVLPYLGLPPGWRFLIAPDYEDVWPDPTLLDV